MVAVHPLLQALDDALAAPQALVELLRVDHMDSRVLYRVNLAELVLLKIAHLWAGVDVLLGTSPPLLVVFLNTGVTTSESQAASP